LGKRFGAVQALIRLDLDVPEGVTFGLIGPNGAGKTTAIRLWLGLTPPTSGTAEVLGHPIPPTPVLPRIGYMPQSLAVYEELTAVENLALFGRLMGMEEDAIHRRMDEMLTFVELAERRADLVSTLSGGMKRRVSLAATFLHDPDLLLLDEPTVGVDPELRDEFWSFFRELTSRGKTVLITTHYMEEASRCDLVGLLFRGRLLARGDPSAIKERTGAENLEDAFLHLVRGKRVEAA
jgi:ABC-2 type transport system ATP-binding protein